MEYVYNTLKLQSKLFVWHEDTVARNIRPRQTQALTIAQHIDFIAFNLKIGHR
jgi:sulfur transfer complex TusBCD TusB component (DsrH family)